MDFLDHLYEIPVRLRMTDAESTNKGDVESNGEEKVGFVGNVLDQWQVLVKIVELVSGVKQLGSKSFESLQI